MGLIELSLWDKLKRTKADKVVGAVEGNFAKLDANGNLVDSGHKDADYEDADATILKEADVVDSLESTSTTAPLSANQGKVLKDAQDVLNADDTTEGSVAKTVKDAVEPIDARVSTLENASAKRYGLRFYTDTGEFVRIGDAVGMVYRNHNGSYTPGVMSDFSLHDPWRGIKPCKMNDDGQILAWYGDGNYDTAVGNEMVFIPRCYTGWTAKTVNSRPCLDIEVSTVPLDGLYPTGFVGSDGELLRGIYVGRTKLGESGGKLKSGAGLAPVVSKSMNSFNADLRAKSATAKWRLNDWTSWMVTTTLMAIEIGTFDVKTAIGPGIQGLGNSYSASNVCTVATENANTFIMAKTRSQYFKVGMMVQIGTAYTNNSIASNRTITDISGYDETNDTITVDGAAFTTTTSSTIATWGQIVPVENMDALKGESGYITRFGSASQSNVCWRWIWDLWGNVWEWLGGVLRVDGKFYLCFDRDNYQSYPVGKAGWIDTDYAPVVENGYQKEREIITYNGGQISLPKTTGGSGVGANTWYAAYLYYFGADYQTGVRAVLVSGYWNNGASVSPFCWHGDDGPSSTSFGNGARAVIEKAS